MSDYLKDLELQEVANWYYRLAKMFAKEKIEGRTPLSALFLKQWLDNRKKDSVFYFSAPLYLQSSPSILEVQQYHRAVFLTEKKARVGSGSKWAGVLPRLQGSKGYIQWSRKTPLLMTYESLCDIAPNVLDILRIQNSGTREERDLFASLRGFQLKSEVMITGSLKPGSKNLCNINFGRWHCIVKDTYDWNYNEYLTVPNPDYGSTAENLVAPEKKTIRVYHINAKRLEDANLAAPYKIESNKWPVTNPVLIAQSEIDIDRNLN